MNAILQIAGQDATPTGGQVREDLVTGDATPTGGRECDTTNSGTGTKKEN